nr:phosphatase PAP2 family protein [Cytophagales bacterium]
MRLTHVFKRPKTWPDFFLTLYFGLLFLLLVGLAFQEKGYWELWINRQHQPLLDDFFKVITNLGDGLMAVFLLIFLIFRSYSAGILLTIGFIIHAVLVHLGKQVFFKGSLRPLAYFQADDLHRVVGVKTALFNTFPSGHTASIFLFVTTILLTQRLNKAWQFSLLIIASIVGLSRVYLLQHFFWDVYAGSLVGVFSALAAYYIMGFFPSTGWMQNRLKISLPSIKLRPLSDWKKV